MKKILICIMMIFLFFASIGVGYFYLNTRNDQKKESRLEENIEYNNIISTQQQEEMISPNTEITKTIYYEKCGHTITEETEAEDEMINLTEEEFEDKFPEWEINSFDTENISIFKKCDETCPEHYIIGESEGIINIYRLNKDGEEELYETTSIYLSYLPEQDQQRIRDKIEVYGMINLNSILENFD